MFGGGDWIKGSDGLSASDWNHKRDQPAGVGEGGAGGGGSNSISGKDEGKKEYSRPTTTKEFIELTRRIEGGDPTDTRPVIDPIDIASGGLAVAMRSVVKVLAAKTVTTYLYQKLGALGEHLKFGITRNPATRYTAEQLAGGKVNIIAEGAKKDMLQLERNLHETLPIGPQEGQRFYLQKQVENGLTPPPYSQ